jgi:hypothetical protein
MLLNKTLGPYLLPWVRKTTAAKMLEDKLPAVKNPELLTNSFSA